MMQYAEDIAPQQRTEHCPLEQYLVLFYSTADCCNTVHVRYGKVKKVQQSTDDRANLCLSFIAISDIAV